MSDADLTYKIIGCAMRVHNELGPGLREKPYENALCIDLREQGLSVEQQRAFPITYHGNVVGDCAPDVVVERTVIVEVKSVDALGESEMAQMLNYLRIAKMTLGLVINFKPPKIDVKRVVL
jgi:GxxExxY protein